MAEVYVLHGEDDFSRAQAVRALKERVQPPELREGNVTTLRGVETSLQEVRAHAATSPFLASARLVVVEGLLGSFEGGPSRRRRESRAGRELGRWAELPSVARSLPPTTLLAFDEGGLSPGNALLKVLRPVAQVQRFPVLRDGELREWISARVRERGGRMTGGAVRLLAELVGGNLWALGGEVEKLALYAGGGEIGEEEVRLLVSPARETSVFALVDAVLEGRGGAAVRYVRQLLTQGETVASMVTMLGRQVRLALLAQELATQRLDEDSLAQRLGVPAPFVARKAREQGRRHGRRRLAALHRRLLQVDTAAKTGGEEEALLEALVAGVGSF